MIVHPATTKWRGPLAHLNRGRGPVRLSKVVHLIAATATFNRGIHVCQIFGSSVAYASELTVAPQCDRPYREATPMLSVQMAPDIPGLLKTSSSRGA